MVAVKIEGEIHAKDMTPWPAHNKCSTSIQEYASALTCVLSLPGRCAVTSGLRLYSAAVMFCSVAAQKKGEKPSVWEGASALSSRPAVELKYDFMENCVTIVDHLLWSSHFNSLPH